MFNKKKGCAIIETAHPLYFKVAAKLRVFVIRK